MIGFIVSNGFIFVFTGIVLFVLSLVIAVLCIGFPGFNKYLILKQNGKEATTLWLVPIFYYSSIVLVILGLISFVLRVIL